MARNRSDHLPGGPDAAGEDFHAQFSVLASAIAGHRMEVTLARATYTDGRTIFLDRTLTAPNDMRDAVAVQAALQAGGSLSRDILRRIAGRRRKSERYLMLELARLAANDPLLPPMTVRRIRQHGTVPLSSSPAESLDWAFGRVDLPSLPLWAGTVRARPFQISLRGLIGMADEGDGGRPGKPSPAETSGQGEAEAIRLTRSTAMSVGTSVGEHAGIETNQVDLGGPRSRRSNRTNPVQLLKTASRLITPAAVAGYEYPEWDEDRQTYRESWTLVSEHDPQVSVEPPPGPPTPLFGRALARVGLEPHRHRRQRDGDTLDIAGLIDHVIDRYRGDRSDPLVYEQSIATIRDLSVLLLLDASGSTNEAVGGDRVFARERLLAGQLVASFDYLGDSAAAYGFYSLGRRNVRFLRIKTFSESFDDVATQRLLSIEPCGFTRLGAALRHATHLLLRNAPAKNMALIVIGDGLPYDDDYEDNYARADTRQAIREAGWSGVGVVGLAIRSSTEPFVHQDIWSHVPFRVVADSTEARSHLRALLTNALRMTRTNGQVPPAGVTDVSAFAISRRSGLNSYV